jgi:hydrogenase maturation protease
VRKADSQKTLVLGLGNPLSGDESFGVRTLDALKAALRPLPPNIVLADAGTDLLNYIEDFLSCSQVILIDAILDPDGKLGQPGSISVLGESEFFSWSDTSPGVHQITPLLGVKLFRTLHPEAQTKITLVGLLVDQITHEVRYATTERTEHAAKTIHSIL